MEYVRLHEFEILLNNYNAMSTMIEVLKLQQKTIISESETDIIEGLVFRRSTSGTPPSKSQVSDKTAQAALNIKKDDCIQEIREISKDILLLDIAIKKIDIARKSLNSKQRKLIECRYFQEMTWQFIANEMLFCVRTLQQIKVDALKKMTVICCISLEDYKRIKELLNI